MGNGDANDHAKGADEVTAANACGESADMAKQRAMDLLRPDKLTPGGICRAVHMSLSVDRADPCHVICVGWRLKGGENQYACSSPCHAKNPQVLRDLNPEKTEITVSELTDRFIAKYTVPFPKDIVEHELLGGMHLAALNMLTEE